MVDDEVFYKNPPMGEWDIRCEKEGVVEEFNERFFLAQLYSDLPASCALFHNRLIDINKLSALAANISKSGWTTLFELEGNSLTVFVDGKDLLTISIFGEEMEKKKDPLYWKDLYLNHRETFDSWFPPFPIED